MEQVRDHHVSYGICGSAPWCPSMPQRSNVCAARFRIGNSIMFLVLAQLLCLSTYCAVSPPLPAVDISDATSTTCSAVTWGAQLQSPEQQQQCNVPSYPCPYLGVYIPQKTWLASPIIGYLFCNWCFFITIPSLVSIVVEIQLQRNARYISLRKAFLYRVIFPIIVPNSLIHIKLWHTAYMRSVHKSNVHSSELWSRLPYCGFCPVRVGVGVGKDWGRERRGPLSFEHSAADDRQGHSLTVHSPLLRLRRITFDSWAYYLAWNLGKQILQK